MAVNAKKVKSIEKRIIPVSDATPYLRALVYGRTGKGKTRFAASAPDVLIVDVNEEGTRSASDSGAHVIQAKTWEDVVYSYWYLKTSDHSYKSVSIDTLTMMQRVCMKHVLREAEDRDPTREPSMPDRRAWGKVGTLMGEYILNFRNLPMNVIFTAQERTIGDEEAGEDLITVPDLSPSSRGVALSAAEIVGRIYQKRVRTASKGKKETSKWETRMLIGPHDAYETKNRGSQELGNIITNPTVPGILDVITQEANDGEEG